MIDASEHYYHDDPNVGHPDVRTELKGVNYFFLGNGLIQVAIQSAPAGDATPLGVLVMNPDRLRKKREAVTIDAVAGVSATMVRLTCGKVVHEPRAGACEVEWRKSAPVPTVRARWAAGGLKVEENFSCPDWATPALCRQITVKNARRVRMAVEISTGVRSASLRRRLVLKAGEKKTLTVLYTLDCAADAVSCAWVRRAPDDAEARAFWGSLAKVKFSHRMLDHFFQTAKTQLPVGVSRIGCVDGSIWQYNLEWLRDQSMVALALTMIGAVGPATTMFTRLLDKFVTPEGDTLDSSEKRNPADVELDQNGCLLTTLKDYVLWTGNVGLVRAKWAKVVAVAEFPLQDIFRHPESGLLMNCREFWERHKAHGIQPGMEMVYQLYVCHGLAAAAVLARLTGHEAEALRWDAESARLKAALLGDKRFRMHDARGFIKRRAPDGQVQETIEADPATGLPAAVPLGGPGPHRLNPDTSSALPIAFGTIPPDSALARRTFKSLEKLWNQDWKTGGYGRYDVSSEPDSPGGWPFASMFVARAAVEAGDHEKVWRVLHWLDGVAGAKSGAWFEFYGRRLAPPFPQVGIVVWNWAELIILYVQHILGVQPQEHGLRFRPRLLSGTKGVAASFLLRGRRLTLRVSRKTGRGPAKFATAAKVLRELPGEVSVAYGAGRVTVGAKV
jgi:hypothetical protein